MEHLIYPGCVSGLPYSRTNYTLLPLPNIRATFVSDAAAFFVQSWMSSVLPQMINVWQNWDDASLEERTDYLSYLSSALLAEVREDDLEKGYTSPILLPGLRLKDDPTRGYANPMGGFAEVMLRWLRQRHAPNQLLVEPAVPQPPGDGKIDFVEITGFSGDYSSMAVTLWEVKSSDGEASIHNPKIYDQLNDYSRRFYTIANHMAEVHKNTAEPELKRFLQNMAKIVRNNHSQAHYGVFVTYDENIAQRVSLVPNLHKYPVGYPASAETHTLAVLMIPDFKNVRLEVWLALHLT